MQNFKVGDWVRAPSGSIYQINETNILHGIEHFTPWQPKEGEWCWFLDNSGELTLKQFLQMCPIVPTNYISKQGLISGSVEPFIGKLPTFLKENT